MGHGGGEGTARPYEERLDRPDLFRDQRAALVGRGNRTRLLQPELAHLPPVAVVELERLIEVGKSLIERRDSLEVFRESAAEHYLRTTGTPWSPRTGSRVNHRALTSAKVDSRDYIAARKLSDAQVLLPDGPKVALTGGLDFIDHRLIWDKLDQVHAKHPDMVLMHGKSPKGAEKIAARWADHRNVPQIGFAPDWTKHGRAALSSATTRCSMFCQSASWSFPAPAFRRTSPTRPGS